ncbi:MAG: hypothetical protein GY906_11465 [bacterium]|nr:hypothetical protein [bacterium]
MPAGNAMPIDDRPLVERLFDVLPDHVQRFDSIREVGGAKILQHITSKSLAWVYRILAGEVALKPKTFKELLDRLMTKGPAEIAAARAVVSVYAESVKCFMLPYPDADKLRHHDEEMADVFASVGRAGALTSSNIADGERSNRDLRVELDALVACRVEIEEAIAAREAALRDRQAGQVEESGPRRVVR